MQDAAAIFRRHLDGDGIWIAMASGPSNHPARMPSADLTTGAASRPLPTENVLCGTLQDRAPNRHRKIFSYHLRFSENKVASFAHENGTKVRKTTEN
jgi:hypothetical protein